MVSKILMTLCVVLAAVAVSQAQWGPQAWGPGAWGPPAGAWGPPAGAWGPSAAAPTAPAANPWIPPWIAAAPWMPKWTTCTTVGKSCVDCNTKQACTKIGGIIKACSDPTLPYCNLGECSATPTTECAPAPVEAVPATAGAV